MTLSNSTPKVRVVEVTVAIDGKRYGQAFEYTPETSPAELRDALEIIEGNLIRTITALLK